ncbi:sensor histidine kinase [Nocardia sp. CNY236]|uniref:sensor histidine kinase n=1 Tax=Nocardia sp. CNY236 TaxID=1169152 RepID=UPI0003FF7DEF|nr:histidine kinase [Nocardia sp. CNY236]
MRKYAGLALIAGACALNGLFLDALPLWRQAVFAGLAVAAYLYGRQVPVTRGWLVQAVVAVPALVYCAVNFSVGIGAILSQGVFVVLPWLAGGFRRQQAELIIAGRERAARLEQEQALIGERAALRERARIAADMHDSLGHDLALMALQAGALELSTDLTESNRAAAQRLRAAAVTATDRLRGTVTVLRDGAAWSTPRDDPVTALVERAVDAGMRVDLHLPEDGTPLPPLTDRAIYRVIQESLTNAARHAPGESVRITVHRAQEDTTVTIVNPVRASITQPAAPGSGLAGLHEQARLVGGTLTAGPEGHDFVVRAQFPSAAP